MIKKFLFLFKGTLCIQFDFRRSELEQQQQKNIRNLLIYLGIPILLVVLLLLLFDRGADQTGLKYSDVLSYFEDGKVSAYSLNLGTGEMKLTVTEDSSKRNPLCATRCRT